MKRLQVPLAFVCKYLYRECLLLSTFFFWFSSNNYHTFFRSSAHTRNQVKLSLLLIPSLAFLATHYLSHSTYLLNMQFLAGLAAAGLIASAAALPQQVDAKSLDLTTTTETKVRDDIPG